MATGFGKRVTFALDKRRRPIPLLDPYAQEALSKAYGEQYGTSDVLPT